MLMCIAPRQSPDTGLGRRRLVSHASIKGSIHDSQAAVLLRTWEVDEAAHRPSAAAATRSLLACRDRDGLICVLLGVRVSVGLA